MTHLNIYRTVILARAVERSRSNLFLIKFFTFNVLDEFLSNHFHSKWEVLKGQSATPFPFKDQ